MAEDIQNEGIVLEGKEALALVAQGKKAWNKFVLENKLSEIKFWKTKIPANSHGDILDFDGYIFPCKTNFALVQFEDFTSFGRAEFRGEVTFGFSTFHKAVEFDGTIFLGDVEFVGASFNAVNITNVTFSHEVSFASAAFGSGVLISATFLVVPDFRTTSFANHISLHGMKVSYQLSEEEEKFLGRTWTKARDAEDSDKFRRLKELAIQAKDHDKELKFFAREMKAKRFYEEKSPLPLVLNYCYEIASEYGRSALRPLIGMFACWSIGVLIYSCLLPVYSLSKFGNVIILSLANLLPFVGSTGKITTDIIDKNTSPWLDLTMMTQGFLAFVFLFFIGLALRNRFRL